jgi:hypothetical protein
MPASTPTNLTVSLKEVNPTVTVNLQLIFTIQAGYSQSTNITLPNFDVPVIDQVALQKKGGIPITDFNGAPIPVSQLIGQTLTFFSNVTKAAGNTVNVQYIFTAGSKPLAVKPQDNVDGANPGVTDEGFFTRITFNNL